MLIQFLNLKMIHRSPNTLTKSKYGTEKTWIIVSGDIQREPEFGIQNTSKQVENKGKTSTN
jgi:hypothetical protein